MENEKEVNVNSANNEEESIEDRIKKLTIEKKKCEEKIKMYVNIKNKNIKTKTVNESIDKSIHFWNMQLDKREIKINELSKKTNKAIEKKEKKKDGKKKDK